AAGGGPLVPDSVLLEIFLYLEPADVLSAGRACRQWHDVARDEFLWKELFYRYYGVSRDVPRHPGARAARGGEPEPAPAAPCAAPGAMEPRGCPTGTARGGCIWSNELDISLQHSSNMRPYNWSYTQFSQFNSDDSLLLVSGVFVGPHNSSSGEIAVISMGKYRSCLHGDSWELSLYGWWLLFRLKVCAGGSCFELSGDPPVRWFVLTCPFCLQGVESENVNVVKRLFKIQNLNASSIRTVMVADCSRYDCPDLLLDYEEQLAASSTCPVFDLGSDSEEEETKPKQTPEPEVQELPDDGAVMAEDGLQQFFDDIMEGRVKPAMTETELETKVAELFVRTRTKPPELNLLPTDSDSNTKYLIFTTGCLTYSPHQIGKAVCEPGARSLPGVCAAALLRIWQRPRSFAAYLWVTPLLPTRYLYVNSRAWPRDCIISDPMQPPPIAEEIDLHVFDLKTMKEVKRPLRAHRAYTPNEECFFIFLDVSRDFVASGAEDRHGYIWDRHYNICLAKLQHDNVVNSVAFSPVEQELLLTASDDSTIKVWRSPRVVRVQQARKLRPRKLLFSWLMNQKS
ncbi:FBXW5 protein, partial [Columbina picui]|nr:FBXW5 protein [Columbina picui]